MSGTMRVGRLFGIDLKVHFSWIFVFILVAWTLAVSFLPDGYPGWSERQYWAIGIVGSLLLFVCVFAHELSHSLEALRRGRRVESITLFFLGGISQMEEDNESASDEFWVSVVGPLTSLGLAVVFWLVYLVSRGGPSQATALVWYLAYVNVAIGLFNLMPALPLDGGRVLKALLWKVTGDEGRATRAASRSGTGLGFGLMALGIMLVMFTQGIAGIWLVLIGWFIQSAASSIREQQTTDTLLSSRTVSEAMRTDFATVGPGTTVQTLLDERIVQDFERAYVVVLGDTFRGLITTADVRNVGPPDREKTWVSEAMIRSEDVVTLSPDAPLEEALDLIVKRGFHQLVVVEDHRAVGLVTRGDVLRVIEVSRLLTSRPVGDADESPGNSQ
ncbi:MAG: site-2 protease family protein [SAR202 cluster bacterium]|nr:site-2 protease family protein [SAR202 cluster bacterium]MDP7224984.1 site-2 protease family protein [SAR202 cluster bacterium]